MTTLCDMVARGKVNVCTTNETDPELVEIKGTIQGELTLSGVGGLVQELAVMVDCSKKANPCTLDFIAHSVVKTNGPSQNGNYLAFGTSTFDLVDPAATDFIANQGQLLKSAGITTIRLLGCETELAIPGRQAIESMRKTLSPHGVNIIGTYGALWALHYGPDGLNKDGAAQLIPQMDEVKVRGLVMGPTVRFDVVDIASQETYRERPSWPAFKLDPAGVPVLARALKQTWRKLPGLLAQPTLQLLVFHEDGGFLRFEIMLRNRLVRAFPTGQRKHGVVAQVMKPDALQALLECNPPVNRTWRS